jgi:Subtilase family
MSRPRRRRPTDGERRRHALLVALLVLVAATALVEPVAASAEVATPTAQAVAADATFLASSPAPPTQAAACFVDTGLHPNPDTTPVVLHSEALDPGQSANDTGIDMHGSRGVMTAFAPRNGWGTVGIWPGGRAVSINALPVGEQAFPFSDYRRAIARCAVLGSAYPIRVIVLALGAATAPGPTEMSLLSDAVDQAQTAGISVVAAAGNSGGSVEWPAAYAPVLAVGAADASGVICGFSARGPGLDLLAPGCPNDEAFADTGAPARASGTSSADVVAAAALDALRGYRPDLSRAAAEQDLIATAHDGNLDVRAAFEAAGLDDVVQAGERAAAQANATPSTSQLVPSHQPPGTRPGAAPARPRHRSAWPSPRVRFVRRGARLLVVLRARPRGAAALIVVQRPAGHATVRTLARRTIRKAATTLKVPRRGRIQLIVRYIADRNHQQSRAVRLALR